MDDSEIVRHIGQLADEERALEEQGIVEGDESAARLHELEVALDQCWDLLRQRRARRDAGLDPDEAQVRPEQVVEHYRQ